MSQNYGRQSEQEGMLCLILRKQQQLQQQLQQQCFTIHFSAVN